MYPGAMGFDWPSNGAGWRHERWGPVEFWHATARSRDELSRANRRVVCIELASFPNTNAALLGARGSERDDNRPNAVWTRRARPTRNQVPPIHDRLTCTRRVTSDLDRKSTRLNSSHPSLSRMPSSA